MPERVKMVRESTFQGMRAVMILALQYLDGQNLFSCSGGIRNMNLREQIDAILGKAEAGE